MHGEKEFNLFNMEVLRKNWKKQSVTHNGQDFCTQYPHMYKQNCPNPI